MAEAAVIASAALPSSTSAVVSRKPPSDGGCCDDVTGVRDPPLVARSLSWQWLLSQITTPLLVKRHRRGRQEEEGGKEEQQQQQQQQQPHLQPKNPRLFSAASPRTPLSRRRHEPPPRRGESCACIPRHTVSSVMALAAAALLLSVCGCLPQTDKGGSYIQLSPPCLSAGTPYSSSARPTAAATARTPTVCHSSLPPSGFSVLMSAALRVGGGEGVTVGSASPSPVIGGAFPFFSSPIPRFLSSAFGSRDRGGGSSSGGSSGGGGGHKRTLASSAFVVVPTATAPTSLGPREGRGQQQQQQQRQKPQSTASWSSSSSSSSPFSTASSSSLPASQRPNAPLPSTHGVYVATTMTGSGVVKKGDYPLGRGGSSNGNNSSIALQQSPATAAFAARGGGETGGGKSGVVGDESSGSSSGSPRVGGGGGPAFLGGLQSQDGMSLRAYIRGHKCLFDDSGIPNGSIVYLLRGADSSQRLLYPLELETNRRFLPGANEALLMFENAQQAIEAAHQAAIEVFRRDSPSSPSSSADEGLQDAVASPLLRLVLEDLQRYHRVLQYGVAAGVKGGFLRPEVLQYASELYDEAGMHFPALLAGVDALDRFYRKSMGQSPGWKENFEPAFLELRSVFEKMQNRTANGSSATTIPLIPERWEGDPDPRTLTPTLSPPLVPPHLEEKRRAQQEQQQQQQQQQADDEPKSVLRQPSGSQQQQQAVAVN